LFESMPNFSMSFATLPATGPPKTASHSLSPLGSICRDEGKLNVQKSTRSGLIQRRMQNMTNLNRDLTRKTEKVRGRGETPTRIVFAGAAG
jgi:hypothetical protein